MRSVLPLVLPLNEARQRDPAIFDRRVHEAGGEGVDVRQPRAGAARDAFVRCFAGRERLDLELVDDVSQADDAPCRMLGLPFSRKR